MGKVVAIAYRANIVPRSQTTSMHHFTFRGPIFQRKLHALEPQHEYKNPLHYGGVKEQTPKIGSFYSGLDLTTHRAFLAFLREGCVATTWLCAPSLIFFISRPKLQVQLSARVASTRAKILCYCKRCSRM